MEWILAESVRILGIPFSDLQVGPSSNGHETRAKYLSHLPNDSLPFIPSHRGEGRWIDGYFHPNMDSLGFLRPRADEGKDFIHLEINQIFFVF